MESCWCNFRDYFRDYFRDHFGDHLRIHVRNDGISYTISEMICEVAPPCLTLSVIGLEFFSSLESGFPGALHLQSTVELVLQHPSYGRSSYPLSSDKKNLNLISSKRKRNWFCNTHFHCRLELKSPGKARS